MQKICRDCGTVGDPKNITKGSIWMEIILWLCFLVPGLIYSIWRLSSRTDGCKACGSTALVPTDSPFGRQMAESNPLIQQSIEPARKPSTAAVSMGRAAGRLFAKKK